LRSNTVVFLSCDEALEIHRSGTLGAWQMGFVRCVPQQIGLRIEFKPQRVDGVALVAAALVIVPPQGLEGKNVGADHRPPRTARTRLSLLLLSLFTLPLLKLTFHALFGLLALEVDDQ
jgi:hypothetical protein